VQNIDVSGSFILRSMQLTPSPVYVNNKLISAGYRISWKIANNGDKQLTQSNFHNCQKISVNYQQKYPV